ncbi:2-octaprenylphenol hydroxylase [Rhodovulum bhavnagarense]|uniref:2-octaprenylphenol hydroxylase n=1 Tax=Rhodovulum bhavnagarense TaxID=992286 RepID=A0A4R2RF23_9RHOB|nr:2-polyprenylphenol 6-hydroxylase [Rhodovulum bhavnagarense]TCP61204.1 2-octaprenylphenol hydroxylase [Rhodovulum bhavnagarense]
MRGPHNIWRLFETLATLERTGANRFVLEAMEAPASVRVMARIFGWPIKWLGKKGDPELPPATRAITALGPAYIKFGQILSTRPDVVGPEMAGQLRYLQDKLPPFSVEVAKQTVAQELGLPADELFSEFSEPIAAASIAQVHRARITRTGEEVAVKVLRPNVERNFRRDINAFYLAASTIEILAPFSRRLRPTDVIAHFDGVVTGELDLRIEASAAAEFDANTHDDPGFVVPRVIWPLSGKRVMTMGWCEGVALGDNAALDAAGHDRYVLGERVLSMFLRHALRDGYFHADMHQGNMKVAANGDIMIFDFGIMGRIDEYTRRVYAEILYGFIRRDYRRVAEVHFEAGYVPPDQNIDEFAQALRSVGEPIFGMDATHISMAKLLAYLFEVTERFGMATRTELILLQRTMVVVEGVARSLNPSINIWEVARPVVEEYIKQNIGPKALARDLARTTRVLARFGPRLPELAESALIAQSNPKHAPVRDNGLRPVQWMAAGAAFTLFGMAVAALF